MLRVTVISLTAFFFTTMNGHAATLVKPGSVTRSVENGVIVYRGSEAPLDAELELEGRASPERITERVIIQRNYGWPPRRLRVQGFTYGVNPRGYPSRRITRGFFSDRIASGY